MAKKNEAPKKEVKKAEPKIKLTKKVLIAAAKDINDADIADPAIDLTSSEEKLKLALRLAAEIIEPEDELKPETFAVLKAVAELEPDADADADADDANELDDDAEIPDEDSLEDLTVTELQAKCKEAGIAFILKKTTKVQLIALLEANQAKVEEDEAAPEPEAKLGKKAGKPAAPAKAEKKEKSGKDFSSTHFGCAGEVLASLSGKKVECEKVITMINKLHRERTGRETTIKQTTRNLISILIPTIVGFGLATYDGTSLTFK